MLSKFSVRKPYTVFVAVILILILGVISFMNLKTDLLPSLDLPYVVVVTPYPGASPEEVETVITRPIEQTLATTSNIKNVSSISNENSSMVILEFNDGANMDSAIIEINGNIDLIKAAWSDSVGTPTVIKMNPDMLPVMMTAVDIEGMDVAELSKIVSEKIMHELESVEGVASVTGIGFVQDSIKVELSPDKIESLNKKILNNIDSELSKAENELEKAKKEINNGLVQLESENEKQTAQLAEGEIAISQAKSELDSALTQLDSAETELQSNKNQVELALNTLVLGENQLIKRQEELKNLGDEITEQEKQELEIIRNSISSLQPEKKNLTDSLTVINASLNEIRTQKNTLISNKDEVLEQEKQIEQGKTLLHTEINNARSQLKEGEATVNKTLAELKNSKEEAFKNANLEGIITDTMISGILTAQNFSMPAGYITDQGVDYLIKVGDKIEDEAEVGKLLLFDTKIDGIGKIYLNDVAEIDMTDNSEESYAKVNGRDVVLLSFQKQSNYSTAEVSNSIRDKIDQITTNDESITITTLMDQGVYIDIIVDSVMKNLIYGAILAILILLVFLKDVKPTLIIALSIPISLVFAIAMMYFTGVTINIISLGGLALGVGMLVDNSVVVIENVYRLKNEGLSSREASIKGARQVAGALIASTLTTVSVFLPIVFTEGISRQIFTDMGLTIAYSLLASLIIALTLVPVLTSKIFNNLNEKEHKTFDKIISVYERLLNKALRHKIIMMAFVVVLLGITVASTFSMGTSFIPEMDGTELSVNLEMDKDSTFEEKIEMTDTIVDRIMDIDGIDSIGAFSNEGNGGMGMGASTNNMSLYVLLDEDKPISNRQIERAIKSRTEDLDVNISIGSSMDISAIAGDGMEIIIKGNDIDKLREISNDIALILTDTEGTVDVKTGFEENAVELRIKVDKEKAMEEGLTVVQVYNSVREIISDGQTATTINVDNKEYPIIVVNSSKQIPAKDDIENMKITIEVEGEEEEIRIGDIAEVIEAQGLPSIKRDAQERYVSVLANIDNEHNIGIVSRDFESKLAKYDVPSGYSVKISGETETINETLFDLLKMILLAIVFIYLIMVAQFQSLLSPFIVMFTIPLAVTGGLLALLITGSDISIISMLGFLVLSGVVVNNGIVFVDYTNQLREQGIGKKEALIETGKVRLRPILMTAITTILGLTTLAIGVGTGAEMLQPLAIVAIGGLIYATLLTLFIVPVMYDIFVKDKKNKQIEGK
ncbi:MMPL family transporter [Alkalibaculum sp. M08DMB]|uniref:MMPL family transporter n=1 Tax=Alkalibaculum sporogenes TaxID=2655001 RepID=A0A6A7K8F0_9FIRM|nr:efflux RND transporter permease subunit [Alkalibaculum sporogenes]MPW25758.1 MMPL family transporter [Alkalibaculum sporogenes]